jgi:hypothetical protein
MYIVARSFSEEDQTISSSFVQMREIEKTAGCLIDILPDRRGFRQRISCLCNITKHKWPMLITMSAPTELALQFVESATRWITHCSVLQWLHRGCKPPPSGCCQWAGGVKPPPKRHPAPVFRPVFCILQKPSVECRTQAAAPARSSYATQAQIHGTHNIGACVQRTPTVHEESLHTIGCECEVDSIIVQNFLLKDDFGIEVVRRDNLTNVRPKARIGNNTAELCDFDCHILSQDYYM